MESSFLHTEAWQRVQQAVGHATLWQNEQLFIENKVLKSSYFVCSRCTVTEDFLPPFNSKPYFVRLEPQDTTAYTNLLSYAKQTGHALIPTFAVQPKQTTVINLALDDEELLKRMHSKHRYNIRLAERQGVSVEVYSEDAEQQFGRFWSLLTSTSARQGFRLHAKEYYQAILAQLSEQAMVHLLFARYQDRDAATLMLITHNGTATYLHGATDTSIQGSMAPYALHWQTIQFAKQQNLSQYDFWGIHAEQTEKGWTPIAGHPSAEVTRLKLGFGGEVITYPGTFDLVLQPFWYQVYTRLRQIRGAKRAFA